MSKDLYTLQSNVGELLQLPAVRAFFDKVSPGMTDGPAMNYLRGATVEQLLENVPKEQHRLFTAMLEIANGRNVDLPDPAKEKPTVSFAGGADYNIDDVDGKMYMLHHGFSGCFALRFSKTMDETVIGKASCNGKVLPPPVIATLALAGNMQLCGIPVYNAFTQYDTDYVLHVEGFADTDGNVMEPVDITVHTLPKPEIDHAYAQHDAVALQVAREGIVLLKNKDNLLPLAPDASLRFAGDYQRFRLGAAGAGRINPRYYMTLMRAVADCSSFVVDDMAEIGVYVLSRGSGENQDNNAIQGEYYLTTAEESAIAELAKTCKHTIVILNTGYPVDVRFVEKYQIGAVVWTGFSGMCGGQALVEILDGRVNPSGKLPDTWSLDYYDIPASANFYNTANGGQVLDAEFPYVVDTCYEEDIYVGYRYFETFGKAVAYPFGFGLSYTQFSIAGNYAENAVTAAVTNIGTRAGKQTVQLYVQAPEAALEQPAKRLIGFAKTKLLKQGESETLRIELQENALSSYNPSTAQWVLEAGEYTFLLGDSVQTVHPCGSMNLQQTRVIKQVQPLMQSPVELQTLSKKNPAFPQGKHSGIKQGQTLPTPRKATTEFAAEKIQPDDFVTKLSIEELARLSVCASHGWGMHEKGEAGRIYRLEQYDMPAFVVADGNNGVNLNKPNIGMPCSNTVAATFSKELAYEVGKTIAAEAKENDIDMILAPALNIHRNPLNGRHPEYFSEDPYLAGRMAGFHCKGLEENGVAGSVKHTIANNCESARKRNHSFIPQRALREIYLKAFEIALSVHQPDSIMTAYNACNGVFAAEDNEMLEGIFRNEFGFQGFVMTDWSSYDSADIVKAVQAGNCWLTPGTLDDTFVTPLVEAVKAGHISEARLRSNIRYLLRVVQTRTGKDLGVL